MTILLRVVLLSLVFGFAGQAHAATSYDIDTKARVVAFGDVHGAYDDWVALLQELSTSSSVLLAARQQFQPLLMAQVLLSPTPFRKTRQEVTST